MSCDIPEEVSIPPQHPVASSAPRPTDTTAVTLADLTTMRVGGPIANYVEADSREAIIETVAQADATNTPLLVIGGGSNLVGASAGFDGVVLRDTREQLTVDQLNGCAGANITVTGGYPWDRLVCDTIEAGWMGLEALSGIPGSAGAAPVQNIGAYGHEVATTLTGIHTYDRLTKQVRYLAASELHFGYRTSALKQSRINPQIGGGKTWGPTGRWVVLDSSFQFRLATLSAPVQYAELAKLLGVRLGERAPATDVRQAVLQLRRSKGMVLNETDRNTYSTGSYFTNPVISAAQADTLPAGAPKFAAPSGEVPAAIGAAAPRQAGMVKTSAAWLIANAGFAPGFSLGTPAAISEYHTLAICNRGGASGDDVRALAAHIANGVHEQFGIELVAEPIVL